MNTGRLFSHALRASALASLVVVVGGASGCGFMRRLAGNDTVDLKKADVEAMSVDIRREKKTICPREPVQMAVFAKVKLEGEKQAKDFETWAGKGSVNKNDKMDFADFAFHSEQGNFDQDGWFTPNPSMLATVGKEMEIKSVFRLRPDKYSFTTTYKPDYTCISNAGGSGPGGQAGNHGEDGRSGSYGQSGGTNGSGGPGGAGSPGGQGGNGTDGQPGPRISAFATMVKTPFYERLIAVKITGDVDDFVLVPEGQAFVLRAAGGDGGSGGSGGHGGSGGSGGSGFVGGNGGQGGQGGNGGNGGNGGPGGSVELVFDNRFPELGNAIKLEAPGGNGGSAGGAGDGGSGGSGGSCSGQNCKSGSQGASGARGASGSPGQSGTGGRVASHAGSVSDKFGALADITFLGDAPKNAEAKVVDAKDDKKGGKAATGAQPKKKKSQP